MLFINLTNTNSPNIMGNEKGSPYDSSLCKKSHIAINTTPKMPSHMNKSCDDSPSHKKTPVAVNSNETSNPQPNKLAAQNKVWHESMSFTKHKVLRNGIRYCCSSWRSKPDCTVILKVFDDGQITCSGKHAPGCCHHNGVKVPAKMPENSSDCE